MGNSCARNWAYFIGNFPILFNMKSVHHWFLQYAIICHYYLFLYIAVPKSPQYYHCIEGERKIQLFPSSYCAHKHPLSTLSDIIHVQQIIWKYFQEIWRFWTYRYFQSWMFWTSFRFGLSNVQDFLYVNIFKGVFIIFIFYKKSIDTFTHIYLF